IRNLATLGATLVDVEPGLSRNYPDSLICRFDRSMRRVAAAYPNGDVVITSLESKRELVRLPRPPGIDSFGPVGILFSPDDLLCAVTFEGPGSQFRTLVWNVDQKKLLTTLPATWIAISFEGQNRGVYFLANQNELAYWDKSLDKVSRRIPLPFPAWHV